MVVNNRKFYKYVVLSLFMEDRDKRSLVLYGANILGPTIIGVGNPIAAIIGGGVRIAERFYHGLEHRFYNRLGKVAGAGYFGYEALMHLAHGRIGYGLLSGAMSAAMAVELGCEVRDSNHSSGRTVKTDFIEAKDGLAGLLSGSGPKQLK